MQTEDAEEEFRIYMNNLFFNSMAIGFPAKVESFNEREQLLDVKILVKEKYNDDEEDYYVDLPMIQNVPFLSTLDFGGFLVTVPIKKGDKVWLTGSNISLDDLLEMDLKDPIDIRESRKFDLSDMVAIATFKTKKDKVSNYDTDNFVIRTKDNETYLKIKPNGEFVMKCVKLQVGSDSADNPLAIANKVNGNFNKLEEWVILVTPIFNTLGIPLPPALYDDVSSGKVFTND